MKKRHESGYILLTALVFMGIFAAISVGLINEVTLSARAERATISSAQALALAEAGIDESVYQLNQNGNYTGETGTALGAGTFTTSVATIDSNTKRITSTGYVPNSTNPVAKRTVRVTVAINSSIVSFRYSAQVGNGGVVMGGGSQINGTLFSDGNISGAGTITGDATVAQGTDLTPDQKWTAQNSGFNLGDTSAHANVAESFKPSVSASLTKLQLNLKKTGTPSDIAIEVVSDNAGSPSKTVLATGSLSASFVTGSYGFADVTFASTTAMTAGTTYWVIAVASVNASNYVTWGDDTAQGYAGGTGKYSSNWNAASPTWTATNADMDFKAYLSGAVTSLSGITVQGNAWAHSLLNCTIGGTATYQSISGCSVAGAQFPVSNDATPAPLPISDAQIADWESIASAGGVISGAYTLSGTQTMGPKEIDGDLTVSNNATLKLSGPVWVKGNISFGNNSSFLVDTSTGNASAVLLADVPGSTDLQGTVDLSNNMTIAGNGNPGSFPIVVSTNTGANAILMGNNASSVVLYAPYGNVTLSNLAAANQITTYKLTMGNNSQMNYVSGLQSTSVSDGPGGSWDVVSGSYAITQ